MFCHQTLVPNELCRNFVSGNFLCVSEKSFVLNKGGSIIVVDGGGRIILSRSTCRPIFRVGKVLVKNEECVVTLSCEGEIDVLKLIDDAGESAYEKRTRAVGFCCVSNEFSRTIPYFSVIPQKPCELLKPRKADPTCLPNSDNSLTAGRDWGLEALMLSENTENDVESSRNDSMNDNEQCLIPLDIFSNRPHYMHYHTYDTNGNKKVNKKSRSFGGNAEKIDNNIIESTITQEPLACWDDRIAVSSAVHFIHIGKRVFVAPGIIQQIIFMNSSDRLVGLSDVAGTQYIWFFCIDFDDDDHLLYLPVISVQINQSYKVKSLSSASTQDLVLLTVKQEFLHMRVSESMSEISGGPGFRVWYARRKLTEDPLFFIPFVGTDDEKPLVTVTSIMMRKERIYHESESSVLHFRTQLYRSTKTGYWTLGTCAACSNDPGEASWGYWNSGYPCGFTFRRFMKDAFERGVVLRGEKVMRTPLPLSEKSGVLYKDDDCLRFLSDLNIAWQVLVNAQGELSVSREKTNFWFPARFVEESIFNCWGGSGSYLYVGRRHNVDIMRSGIGLENVSELDIGGNSNILGIFSSSNNSMIVLSKLKESYLYKNSEITQVFKDRILYAEFQEVGSTHSPRSMFFVCRKFLGIYKFNGVENNNNMSIVKLESEIVCFSVKHGFLLFCCVDGIVRFYKYDNFESVQVINSALECNKSYCMLTLLDTASLSYAYACLETNTLSFYGRLAPSIPLASNLTGIASLNEDIILLGFRCGTVLCYKLKGGEIQFESEYLLSVSFQIITFLPHRNQVYAYIPGDVLYHFTINDPPVVLNPDQLSCTSSDFGNQNFETKNTENSNNNDIIVNSNYSDIILRVAEILASKRPLNDEIFRRCYNILNKNQDGNYLSIYQVLARLTVSLGAACPQNVNNNEGFDDNDTLLTGALIARAEYIIKEADMSQWYPGYEFQTQKSKNLYSKISVVPINLKFETRACCICNNDSVSFVSQDFKVFVGFLNRQNLFTKIFRLALSFRLVDLIPHFEDSDLMICIGQKNSISSIYLLRKQICFSNPIVYSLNFDSHISKKDSGSAAYLEETPLSLGWWELPKNCFDNKQEKRNSFLHNSYSEMINYNLSFPPQKTGIFNHMYQCISPKPPKKHKCALCDTIFPRKLNLIQHLKNSHQIVRNSKDMDQFCDKQAINEEKQTNHHHGDNNNDDDDDDNKKHLFVLDDKQNKFVKFSDTTNKTQTQTQNLFTKYHTQKHFNTQILLVGSTIVDSHQPSDNNTPHACGCLRLFYVNTNPWRRDPVCRFETVVLREDWKGGEWKDAPGQLLGSELARTRLIAWAQKWTVSDPFDSTCWFFCSIEENTGWIPVAWLEGETHDITRTSELIPTADYFFLQLCYKVLYHAPVTCFTSFWDNSYLAVGAGSLVSIIKLNHMVWKNEFDSPEISLEHVAAGEFSFGSLLKLESRKDLLVATDSHEGVFFLSFNEEDRTLRCISDSCHLLSPFRSALMSSEIFASISRDGGSLSLGGFNEAESFSAEIGRVGLCGSELVGIVGAGLSKLNGLSGKVLESKLVYGLDPECSPHEFNFLQTRFSHKLLCVSRPGSLSAISLVGSLNDDTARESGCAGIAFEVWLLIVVLGGFEGRVSWAADRLLDRWVNSVAGIDDETYTRVFETDVSENNNVNNEMRVSIKNDDNNAMCDVDFSYHNNDNHNNDNNNNDNHNNDNNNNDNDYDYESLSLSSSVGEIMSKNSGNKEERVLLSQTIMDRIITDPIIQENNSNNNNNDNSLNNNKTIKIEIMESTKLIGDVYNCTNGKKVYARCFKDEIQPRIVKSTIPYQFECGTLNEDLNYKWDDSPRVTSSSLLPYVTNTFIDSNKTSLINLIPDENNEKKFVEIYKKIVSEMGSNLTPSLHTVMSNSINQMKYSKLINIIKKDKKNFTFTNRLNFTFPLTSLDRTLLRSSKHITANIIKNRALVDSLFPNQNKSDNNNTNNDNNHSILNEQKQKMDAQRERAFYTFTWTNEYLNDLRLWWAHRFLHAIKNARTNGPLFKELFLTTFRDDDEDEDYEDEEEREEAIGGEEKIRLSSSMTTTRKQQQPQQTNENAKTGVLDSLKSLMMSLTKSSWLGTSSSSDLLLPGTEETNHINQNQNQVLSPPDNNNNDDDYNNNTHQSSTAGSSAVDNSSSGLLNASFYQDDSINIKPDEGSIERGERGRERGERGEKEGVANSSSSFQRKKRRSRRQKRGEETYFFGKRNLPHNNTNTTSLNNDTPHSNNSIDLDILLELTRLSSPSKAQLSELFLLLPSAPSFDQVLHAVRALAAPATQC